MKKFFSLRKYLFLNLIALWFYCLLFFTLGLKAARGWSVLVWVELILISIVILGVFILLAIIEIPVRKYILEKRFPDFKLNLNFKIPKLIINIYNVIFCIGFVSTCFLISLAIPLFIGLISFGIVNLF